MQEGQNNSLLGRLVGRLMSGSLVRYGIVGVSGALLDYGVFQLVYRLLQVSMPVAAKALANGSGMVVGGVFCYTLNRIWSFRSGGRVLQQATAYAALTVLNIFLSSGLIYLLGALTGLPANLCKLVAMVAIFVWNYLINRFFIFRSKKAPEQAQ